MKRCLTLTLALIFALLVAIPAAAQGQVIGYVNTGVLNLRPVPSAVNNTPIAEIPRNYPVVLTARTADGSWYRAIYDPNGYTPLTGWVSSGYITITEGNVNTLPISDGSPTAIAATGMINTGALNIRPLPSATNNVPLLVLYQGSTVDVIGRTADSQWVKVVVGYDGQVGWARSRYITLTDGSRLENLPVVSTTPTIPTPTPPAALVQGTVNTGALNIRPVPRWWGNQPITFVYRGTTFAVIGRNSDASWYQVSLSNGTVGWARSRYVDVTGNIGTLPITG